MRNDQSHLARAIESVLAQTYPAIEYIVKDGQSSDGTLGIIEKYRDRIATVVSSADRGISDAWNQALQLATGSVILLLNSDDRLDADLVANGVACLQASGADLAYGNTSVTAEPPALARNVIGQWRPSRLWRGIGFLHPGVLCSRHVYNQIGGFDESLRYAMDADWLLRAHAAGFKFTSHGRWSYMADSGISNLQWMDARNEYLTVLARHRVSLFTRTLGRVWLNLLRVKKALT